MNDFLPESDQIETPTESPDVSSLDSRLSQAEDIQPFPAEDPPPSPEPIEQPTADPSSSPTYVGDKLTAPEKITDSTPPIEIEKEPSKEGGKKKEEIVEGKKSTPELNLNRPSSPEGN